MEGALGNKRLHAQDLGRFQIRRLLARPAELRPCDGYCRVSEYLQVLWLLGPARVCLIPQLQSMYPWAVNGYWYVLRVLCLYCLHNVFSAGAPRRHGLAKAGLIRAAGRRTSAVTPMHMVLVAHTRPSTGISSQVCERKGAHCYSPLLSNEKQKIIVPL